MATGDSNLNAFVPQTQFGPTLPAVPQPYAPGPAATKVPTNLPAGMGTPQWVRDQFKSRGVTPYETSPDSWAKYWTQWGSKDPNYYMERFNAADEFIGGPQNSPYKDAATADMTDPAQRRSLYSGMTAQDPNALFQQLMQQVSRPVQQG